MWYYEQNGNRIGPVDEATMRSLIATGRELGVASRLSDGTGSSDPSEPRPGRSKLLRPLGRVEVMKVSEGAGCRHQGEVLDRLVWR